MLITNLAEEIKFFKLLSMNFHWEI